VDSGTPPDARNAIGEAIDPFREDLLAITSTGAGVNALLAIVIQTELWRWKRKIMPRAAPVAARTSHTGPE
jgi:hypothetical protein